MPQRVNVSEESVCCSLSLDSGANSCVFLDGAKCAGSNLGVRNLAASLNENFRKWAATKFRRERVVLEGIQQICVICLWIVAIRELSGEAQSHLDLLGYLDLKVYLWDIRPAVQGTARMPAGVLLLFDSLHLRSLSPATQKLLAKSPTSFWCFSWGCN